MTHCELHGRNCGRHCENWVISGSMLVLASLITAMASHLQFEPTLLLATLGTVCIAYGGLRGRLAMA